MDEFDIIEKYFSVISAGADHVSIGPGDDCAVLQMPAGAELCISTDTLIEGVHFPTGASGEIAAARAVGANLSDLAAMGAEPYAVTIALTFPNVNEVWLGEFSSALKRLLAEYGMPLVGGNLSRGPLSITPTVLGTVPVGQALRRIGASVGEDIYVSGYPGDASCGLNMFLAGESQCSSTTCWQRYVNPVPRLTLGKALRGVATAVIDVSDGLAADLGHICEASHVGAEIRADLLPQSADLQKWGSDPVARAVAGGDDYELCFTAPTSERQAIQDISRNLALPLTVIGHVTQEGGVRVLDGYGTELSVSPGYRHFSQG